MNTGIFIALLNPSIALVLAVACLLLWFYQKTRPYMAVLAAGYAATALGFLLQHFELPIGFYPTKFVSNVFFVTAGVLVSSAIVSRYQRPVPYALFLLLAGAGLAGFLWFMVVDPSLTWRIYAMNFALGGMAFVVDRRGLQGPQQDRSRPAADGRSLPDRRELHGPDRHSRRHEWRARKL